MKIYVAGKWKERQRIRDFMDILETRGHEITTDWTKHEHPDKSQEYALEDLHGIKNCDIFIACMWNKDTFYKGAWIEFGIAIGQNKKVILIGEDIFSVFLGYPDVTVCRDETEALNIVHVAKNIFELHEELWCTDKR